MQPKFAQEFNTLNYVIQESDQILLWAHNHPDGDSVGSVLALKEYAVSLGKKVDLGCNDPLPEYLSFLTEKETLLSPEEINFSKYKLIIACDSADRGFNLVREKFNDNQVIAILDHHLNHKTFGDINIIEPHASSVCELVYDFFVFNKLTITKRIANTILTGIIFDTGKFQHSNTSAKVMELSSELIKKGAHLKRIVSSLFENKNISALKIWGRTFEKAKINSENGMIVSVLSKKDIEECQASTEDISQLSSILNTVPNTKFAMILSEREGGKIKGSLRSEEYKDIDVAKIASQFGGGGHKLAAGFELEGRIVETKDSWEII